MEFRLFILSIACFSCLIPSAVSINLLAAKAVANQAKQDIASIGFQTIAAKKAAIVQAASDIASIAAQGVELKGQAVKKAATSIAGAMINGAASIGATIVKAGINMVAAKFGAKPIKTLVYEPSIVFQSPVLQEAVIQESVVQEPVVVECDQAFEVPVQMQPFSTVSVDVRPPLIDLPAPPQLSSVWTLNEAVPSVEVVGPSEFPYIYEIVDTPRVQFSGPLIDTFQFGKK